MHSIKILLIIGIALSLPFSKSYSQGIDSIKISLEDAYYNADVRSRLVKCESAYNTLFLFCDSAMTKAENTIDLKNQAIDSLQKQVNLKDAQISIMYDQRQSFQREINTLSRANESLSEVISRQRKSWKVPVIAVGVGALVGTIVSAITIPKTNQGLGSAIGVGSGLISTITIIATFSK